MLIKTADALVATGLVEDASGLEAVAAKYAIGLRRLLLR